MVYLLKIILMVVSTLCIASVISGKKVFCSMLPIFLVYNITMILPMVLEIFLGVPYRGYYGLKLSLNDDITTCIYCIFALLTELILYMELRKQIKKATSISFATEYHTWRQDVISQFGVKGNKGKFIQLLSILGIVAFIIAIVCAPNPLVYFKQLGAFSMFDTFRSAAELQYHRNIMIKIVYVVTGCIVLNKLADVDEKFLQNIIRNFAILLIVFVNGKRSLVMILIGSMVLIDLIRNPRRKKIKYEIILAGLLLAGYFVVYAYITGKVYYNTNWYSVINEYFFRSETSRAAIYSINHPEKLKILDYPGQSIIYNLFYFIPRFLWPSKPNPYSVYYFSAINGYNSLVIADWRFQTSIWAEFISNFGYAGMILVDVFIIWFSRFLNKRKFVCKTLGIGLICILQLFEYSDMMKVIALIVLALFLSERLKVKNNTIFLIVKDENKRSN